MIKQLAQQAGIHPTNFESDADLREPLLKFAQLISEELAGTLSRLPTGGTDSALWYKHQRAFNKHLGL